MPAHRLFPHALIAIAAVMAFAPSANASLTAAWVGGDTLLHDGAREGGDSNIIADSAGNVYAYWIGESADSGTRLLVARRAKGAASWGAPVEVGSAGAEYGAGQSSAFAPAAVVNPDGDLTVAWAHNNGGSRDIETATIDTADGSWDGQTQRIPTDHGQARCVNLVVDAGGTQTLIWQDYDEIFADRKIAGQAWAPRQKISDALNGGEPIAHVGSNGDVTVSWGLSASSNLVSALYLKDTESWNPAVTKVYPRQALMRRLIDDGNGGSVMTWFDPTNYPTSGDAYVMRRAAGSSEWSDPEVLNQAGVFAATPDVAALPNGDLYLIWSEFDFNTYLATQKSRTWSAATNTWSDETVVSGPEVFGYAGARIMAKANGDLVSAVLRYTSPGPIVAVWTRDHTTGVWSEPSEIAGTQMEVNNVASITLDNQGNLLVSWDERPGSARSAHAAIADTAGPELSDVTVPSSGTVGDTLSFSVGAADAWSDVAATSFSFGDGTEKSGTSATHEYAAPGSYTVTITSTDSLGNASTATRTVTISAPPAPAPDDTGDDDVPPPPKVRAPVIEARLAGRTITFNAKVNLRAGKKCTGKTSATTTFGNATYRTTLTLKLDGTTCRATGTIKLKKTPSARTKLRITISGKNTKTRTLATKRG